MTLWNKEAALRHFGGEHLEDKELHSLYSLLMEHPQITDYCQASPSVVHKMLTTLQPTGVVRKHPYFGMTTVQEQAYCEWYCSQIYSGSGAIVELGSFLGSLSKAMVDGLRANPNLATRDSKVWVHDLFWWDFVMAACVRGTPYEGCCKEGDWFIEFYRRGVRPWIDRLEVRQADLTQFKYEQQPIEFLMLDVMKYEGLVRQVTPQFFPCLIPGKGILFNQDYLHFYESWVHVIQYLLRDCFEPVTPIHGSGAFIFKCVRQVPLDRCKWHKPLAELWSDDLVEEAFAYSLHVCKEYPDCAASAHVMMYMHLNRVERAKKTYRHYVDSYQHTHSFKEMTDYCLSSLGVDFSV